MRFQRLFLPSTTYGITSSLQNGLVRRVLDSKPHGSLSNPVKSIALPPSEFDGTFITFEPKDHTYTLGRREKGTLTTDQQDVLRQPGAHLVETLRGGQITYHGPGQLVAYPILDLRRIGLTPRCYIDALEGAVIDTLARYDIKGFRTDNPGVWVSNTHKICAVGVHLRRNITSHGIALNVKTDLSWFDRIVACGLIGKSTSTLEREGVETNVPDVEAVFVEELAKRIAKGKAYELVDVSLEDLSEH
jgi:lipoate-protein ligase B